MPVDSEYIARFKADLVSLPSAEVYERYILPEACMGPLELDQEGLRGRIAAQFGINLTSIVIVGSAKLGFTLRAKSAYDDKEMRPPFSLFSDNSDVDVAIVSDALFDRIWKLCFEFWHSSGYGDAINYWPRARYFRDYIFRGWMRPDHLPSEGGFTYKAEWFDFFRQLTSDRAAGDYKVTAGLYREAYFLEAYQRIAIDQCRAGVVGTL